MKRNLQLLLPILSILLTLACLGSPEPTTQPVSNATSLPGPSTAPTPTVMPAQFPGLKIAYILDGNIWFWGGSAPACQLTSNGEAVQVKISDDGEIIAYQRGLTRLWAVNADCSSPNEQVGELMGNFKMYEMSPPPIHGMILTFKQIDFQPHTHWIYFNTKWIKGNAVHPSNDLHRVNADDPKEEVLTIENGGNFTFSPDGKRLALSSLTSIKVIHADGSGLVTALNYPTISLETGYIPQVVWMENGTGFYTVLPDNAGISTRYMFVSVDGSISAQLANLESDMSAPIISPNGLKVAYVKQTAAADELHVMEASNADTIIASYEGAPMLVPWNWSPDSKRVVFSNAHPMLLLTAGIGIPPFPLTEVISPHSLCWVNAEHFIFFREGELLIGQINNPETISIASGFANDLSDTKHYDFTINSLP